MQATQSMIVTDDFIPLYVIEAARFEKGLFGSYKQSRDWICGSIVHKNVVFNTDVISQQPRKLLMTMLLYWRSSADYYWATHIEIVTKAFRYFFDHYRDSCRFDIVNAKFFADEALTMIILLLKFYPESEELSRLLKMILPAFLGATNAPEVGHIFNRRPFVFDLSDEVRGMSMDQLIAKLGINGKLTDFLHQVMTEQQRRVTRREVVKLECEALIIFLQRFLGFTADDCNSVLVTLDRVPVAIGNRRSLNAFYKTMLPWNTRVPAIRHKISPIPMCLLFTTLDVMFSKPIEVNGVCSGCWVMQQPGAPQRLGCIIHRKVEHQMPSVPHVDVEIVPVEPKQVFAEPPVENSPSLTSVELPECPMCLSCKVQVVIVPCGHFVCGACSAQIKNCPLCRGSIDKFVKCYF